MSGAAGWAAKVLHGTPGMEASAAALFRTIFLRTVVDRLIAKYDKSASFVK
jgi:hypothetical protein